MSFASRDATMKDPTYPTGSLDFLELLRKPEWSSRCLYSAVRLKVLIAGAGVAGLSTAIALARRGHEVIVFEQASKLAEVGAGIQVPPNSLRMLLDWGLADYLHQRYTEPNGVFCRRWQTGEVIADTRYRPEFRKKYRAPYYVIHRAHLHDALHRLAVRRGVTVKLASKVVAVNRQLGWLSLDDGAQYQGDLIVAADGVKSVMRNLVFGGKTGPNKTGFVCFRCIVDVDEMKKDPEIAWLVEEPNLNLWVGPGGHVMTYTIAGGKSFNVVVNRADTTDPETWEQSKALEEMQGLMQGWDPQIVKVLGLVKQTMKWPIYSVPTLQNWVKGRTVILGDAAHAMLPYMSQGAAIAVEDGAALAEALHQMDDPDQIREALSLWESVQKVRASQMQQASELNSILWHFPDGPEQKARDESTRPEVEGRPFTSSANQWSDPTTQRWTYGYDAEAEIRKAWRQQTSRAERNDSALTSPCGSVAGNIERE